MYKYLFYINDEYIGWELGINRRTALSSFLKNNKRKNDYYKNYRKSLIKSKRVDYD